MNYYVEIPYAFVTALSFPDICPLTLDENPDSEWEIEGNSKRGPVLALPAVPIMVVRQHKFILPVPAAARFVKIQRLLALLSISLGALFILGLSLSLIIPALGKISQLEPVMGALAVVALCAYICKCWLARRVWIDYVGDEFVEVVFKRKAYAEDFCNLNGLKFRRKFINFRSD